MDFGTVFEQIGILLLVGAAGGIAYRTNIFDAHSMRKIADLIVYVTMPCMTIATATGAEELMSAPDVLAAFWPLCLVYAVGAAVAMPLLYLTRMKKEQFGTHAFMITFPNVGFMGYPVVLALFGEQSATYLALMQIPYSLLVYTLGVYMLAGRQAFRKQIWRQLLSPMLLAPMLAIVMVLFELRLPSFLQGAADLLGRSTTPLAMIVMGATVASMSMKSIRNFWRVALTGLTRLLVVPVLMWLILRGVVKNELLLGVTTVLAAMPSATNTAFMSVKYGGDQEQAAQGVFFSTVLSAATIPLLIYLLLR